MRAVLAISALLLSCVNSAPLDPAPTAHIGEWEWVRSSGSIAGVQRTPESEGYTVRIEFRADQTVRAFRGGDLVAEGTYTIAERLEDGTAVAYEIRYQPALVVFPFAAFEEQVARVTADGLRLTDPCCDRYDHEFRGN